MIVNIRKTNAMVTVNIGQTNVMVNDKQESDDFCCVAS